MRVWSPALVLARTRWRIFRNMLLDLRGDSIAKYAAIGLGLTVVVSLAYVVAYHSFQFIEGFLAIGAPLNSRLLGVLFMVLFTMVTISTAIVAYTSLFIARETGFFFEHPIPPVTIFFFKVLESTLFSGWATFILCMPVLTAFGVLREASASYYIEAAAILVLFIGFCGLTGALATVVLLLAVRRWTLQKLAIISVALVGLVGWGFLESFDFTALNGEDNLLALNRFTMNLSTLQAPFLPSTWATAAVLSAAAGHHQEVLFNMGLLLANAMITLPLLGRYGRRVYGRRWLSTSEPQPFWSRSSGAIPARRVRAARERIRRPDVITRPMDALTRKDLLTFVRAPAQVSQFVLFLALLVVYVLSLTQIPSNLFTRGWRLVLFYSNAAAICLILSSFTSRFLFPLISLEGKSFWILGLAPVDRSFLLRQKLRFGQYLILSLAIAAAACSSISLRFDAQQFLSLLFLVTLSSWLLTSLAVSFGAAYPNFGEDNPARIAVGLGGTLNFFASALSVILLIVAQAAPYLWPPHRPSGLAVLLTHLGTLAGTALVCRAATGVGARALGRMEY